MSLYSYRQSQRISGARADYDFDALIMSAMRKADTFNSQKLREAFPQIYEEFVQRYNAPGGCLAGERQTHVMDEDLVFEP